MRFMTGLNRSAILCFFGALILSVKLYSQPNPDVIAEKDSREIMSFLASGKLKGRADFSNGQVKAAEFIGNYFGECGLEPFKDAAGYYHPFATTELYEKKLAPNSISWNGKDLTPEQYYYSYSLPELKKLYIENFRVIEVRQSLSPEMMGNFAQDNRPLLIWFAETALIDSITRSSLNQLTKLRHKKVLVVRHGSPPKKIIVEVDSFYKGNILFNIAGVLPGKSRAREIVIFSAHYDHVTKNPFGQYGVFSGANDNASGVTALLQLARYFSLLGPQERTILFVAFSGEERGLLGSTVFAEQVNPDGIACVLNIEMVGRHNVAGEDAFMVTGQNKSDLADLLSRRLPGTGVKIIPAPKVRDDLFMRSDNYPFYRKRIPAHSIMCSDDEDPCYHQACDTAGNIDYPNMTRIIRSIAVAVGGIVDGTETPENK
jgi:hypothetical protein